MFWAACLSRLWNHCLSGDSWRDLVKKHCAADPPRAQVRGMGPLCVAADEEGAAHGVDREQEPPPEVPSDEEMVIDRLRGCPIPASASSGPAHPHKCSVCGFQAKSSAGLPCMVEESTICRVL
eukprot:6492384-Amphidinium_carterae.16